MAKLKTKIRGPKRKIVSRYTSVFGLRVRRLACGHEATETQGGKAAKQKLAHCYTCGSMLSLHEALKYVPNFES